jgi:hypothetical protein
MILVAGFLECQSSARRTDNLGMPLFFRVFQLLSAQMRSPGVRLQHAPAKLPHSAMNTFRPLGRIHWHIIARSNEEDMMFCIHIIHRTSHSFGKHEAYGHWAIPISFMPSAVLAAVSRLAAPLGLCRCRAYQGV